jgi:F-type H+-transporting ATPase subunit delta
MARRESDRPSPTAVAYAQSMLDLANEQKNAEPLGRELAELKQVIEQNPTAREMLSNPAISIDERSRMLDRVFRGKVGDLLFRVLNVMNQHNRLGLLEQVATSYGNLLDEQLGKVEVDVIVAQKLSNDQLEAAKKKITAAIGRDAVLHQYVDDSIVGGMIVRVGDKLIDASVRSQLQAMKQQLLSSAPK